MLLETVIASASAPGSAMQASDITLRLLEHLALESEPRGVTEIAEAMGLAKTTAHRHLRTLIERDFVRQHASTQRYEPGIKLLQLGERLRERFSLGRSAREVMQALRDASGQAVTLSALIDGRVIVVDLVQGHSVIEFGIRPGTEMSLQVSAHGRSALAFAPAAVFTPPAKRAPQPGQSPGQSPGRRPAPSALTERQLAAIRRQGWVTAANEVVFGINALAAPIVGSGGRYLGAIAIVGSVQYIPARPAPRQIKLVTEAAAAISAHMGWRAH